MTTLRAQISLLNQSGLPVDTATNTWHFRSNSVDRLDDFALIDDALTDFYQSIGGIFSSVTDSPLVLKVYDLADSEPRVPIDTSTINITTATGTPLPNEVAICMSFQAAALSGSAAGRRRGRIFLGPLDGSTLDEAASDGRVQAGTLTTIATAANTLIGVANPANITWAVFSPTTAGPPPWSTGEILAATFDVTHGFVDNAFDTIRSRGTLPSSRTTF